MTKQSISKSIALCGMLSGLAFGLSYIEMLLPGLSIPGAKLGLANLAVLAALYILSWKEAAAVSLIRIILSWLLFGSFTAMIYSLCGGILSLTAMALLKKCRKFSPVGVSAAGGVCHNIGQLLAAFFIMGKGVLGYLPSLIIFGLIAGGIIGVICSGIIGALKNAAKL